MNSFPRRKINVWFEFLVNLGVSKSVTISKTLVHVRNYCTFDCFFRILDSIRNFGQTLVQPDKQKICLSPKVGK